MNPWVPEFPDARLVDRLDLDSLPTGCVCRLLLEVAHGGMGQAIRLPILVARGTKPGPVFGMTAALHGNELNGIPVIHELFARVDPSRLKGSLVGVAVVNIPGFNDNERTLNGVDLNHQFPGNPDGRTPKVYAWRLIDRVIRHFHYLVDMHTASFGRVNSLYIRADMGSAMAAKMARLQRPQIILDDPPSDSTLRGRADELGIPAITVEIGNPQRFQTEYIRRTLAGLRATLFEVDMLPKRKHTEVPDAIVCSRASWFYTDHGGLLEVFPDVVQRVAKGEAIARLSNIFGDVVREYRAPYAGVVIGKSVNPVAETGARIAHLGVVAEDPIEALALKKEIVAPSDEEE